MEPDPDPAQLKKIPDPTPDSTLNRNEEKNIFISEVGRHNIRSYKPSFYA